MNIADRNCVRGIAVVALLLLCGPSRASETDSQGELTTSAREIISPDGSKTLRQKRMTWATSDGRSRELAIDGEQGTATIVLMEPAKEPLRFDASTREREQNKEGPPQNADPGIRDWLRGTPEREAEPGARREAKVTGIPMGRQGNLGSKTIDGVVASGWFTEFEPAPSETPGLPKMVRWERWRDATGVPIETTQTFEYQDGTIDSRTYSFRYAVPMPDELRVKIDGVLQ